MRIVTEYEDGRYYMKPWRLEEHHSRLLASADIPRLVWWAYRLHELIGRKFQRYIQRIDNKLLDQYYAEAKR